jgi:transcriptional regulator of acetoin/glycerol metabolism
MENSDRIAAPEPGGDLLPLLDRLQPFLGAWYRSYQSDLGPRARLTRDEFQSLLGKEIERLAEPGALASTETVDAALRPTAASLARRGIPLADLLAAVALEDRAASEALGPTVYGPLAPALARLERERSRVYRQVYLQLGETAGRPCVAAADGADPFPAPHASPPDVHGIVGDSPEIRAMLEAIQAAARARRDVLVWGEPGSGKRLVARAIHAAGGGDRGRFVAVECAALPRHLGESELFGHAVGAFAGASAEYAGLLRAADGGTLLLEEIGDLAPDLQAALVRTLEERAVRPVGSARTIPIQLRLIASSARNPLDLVTEGRLREDLFHRLQPYSVTVPPLREHRSDIPLLVEHFLAGFCHRRAGCVWGVTDEAMDALMAAPWPGNVRELRQVIEETVFTGTSNWVRIEDLPARLRADRARSAEEDREAALPTLAQAESQLIRRALAQCGGNKVRAAKALGISRHKLYDKLRKIGLA